MASTAFLQEAAHAWKYLNGIVCLYKPLGLSSRKLRLLLREKLCEDLNSMKCREPESFVKIERVAAGKRKGSSSTQIQAPTPSSSASGNLMNADFTPQILHTLPDTPKTKVQVIKTINYADHPLVVGPRYQPTDLKLFHVNLLGMDSSGVTLIGLKDGTSTGFKVHRKRWLRGYALSAELGKASEDGFYTSKIIEKTKYHKITSKMLEKVLMSMQSAHQRAMYQAIKVPLTSPVAYELASQGLVRPDDRTEPIVYNLKLTKFEPPHFEIEVHVINETETYLKTIPHLVALKLRSSAVCTKIRCFKYGPFSVDNALLMKHWTVEEVLNNLHTSMNIIREHNLHTREGIIGAGGSEMREDDENQENESRQESQETTDSSESRIN